MKGVGGAAVDHESYIIVDGADDRGLPLLDQHRIILSPHGTESQGNFFIIITSPSIMAEDAAGPAFPRVRLKPEVFQTVDYKTIVEDDLLHFLAMNGSAATRSDVTGGQVHLLPPATLEEATSAVSFRSATSHPIPQSGPTLYQYARYQSGFTCQ